MKSSDTQEPLKPWKQQPKETAKHFAAFRRFMELAPDLRSVQGAFDDAMQMRFPGIERRRSPRHWRDWAKKFNWVERAKAWDDHSQEILIVQREQIMLELEERRLRYESARHDAYKKAVEKLEADMEKALALPRTDFDEVKYDPNGNVTARRKVRGIRPHEIAALRKEINDTDRIATHGHFKINKSMKIEEEPVEDGQENGPARRLNLIVPDYAPEEEPKE